MLTYVNFMLERLFDNSFYRLLQALILSFHVESDQFRASRSISHGLRPCLAMETRWATLETQRFLFFGLCGEIVSEPSCVRAFLTLRYDSDS